MGAVRLSLLWLVIAGCATRAPPPVAPKKPPAPVKTTDDVAVDAERRLNSAERALDELRPDDAVNELEAADKDLEDPKIENYPEANELRARYRALLARLPEAREALRKKELAAAVAAAKEKIEAARAGLKELQPEAVEAVKKALDDAGDLESKDPEFSKYTLAVRKDLAEKKALIEKKQLEAEIAAQKTAVSGAVGEAKRLAAQLKTAEDIQAAEAAAAEVEKVLDAGEKLNSRDTGYSKYSVEMRKFIAGYRKKVRERAAELGVDVLEAGVEVKLDALASAVAGLNTFSPGEAEFKAVDAAVDEVKKALDAGVEMEGKNARYKEFAVGARKRVKVAEERAAKRKAELAARERRMLIEDAVAAAKTAVEGVTKPGATAGEQELKDAEAALKTAREQMVEGVVFEKKDPTFGKFAAATRKKLTAMRGALDGARLAGTFNAGPVAAVNEGLQHLETAAGQVGEEQAKAYSAAIESFRRCRRDAVTLLAEQPRVGEIEVTLGSKRVRAKGALKICGDYAEAVEKKLAKLKTSLAFYEGPAKSFEAARAANTPGEALAHYEACLGAGKILAHQQPGLKKKQFDLAGGKTTLVKLIADCKKEVKALRALAATDTAPPTTITVDPTESSTTTTTKPAGQAKPAT